MYHLGPIWLFGQVYRFPYGYEIFLCIWEQLGNTGLVPAFGGRVIREKIISETVVTIIYYSHLIIDNNEIKGNKVTFARFYRNLLRKMKLEHKSLTSVVT